MIEILQNAIPDDMNSLRALPGVQPLQGPWLRVDEAYAGQMAHRRALIATRLPDVYRMEPGADDACAEVLEQALALLPGLGFVRDGTAMICPDGVRVPLDGPPLVALGQLVQEDICVLQKQEDEHVLTAACMCFPASWHLEDKIGQPLGRIHKPVAEYDASMSTRVQRLFDGVQLGRPLWRFNHLIYADAELHQPRRETDPRRDTDTGHGLFERAERQCIARMPDTHAVVFSIHTYVVRREPGAL